MPKITIAFLERQLELANTKLRTAEAAVTFKESLLEEVTKQRDRLERQLKATMENENVSRRDISIHAGTISDLARAFANLTQK